MRVYIDGACSGNPGPGGYAAVAMDNNQFTLICLCSQLCYRQAQEAEKPRPVAAI